MFNDAKYVVLTNDENGHGMEQIFVFPSNINHVDFAKAMNRCARLPFVVSAGFVNEFMKCYGSSQTLHASSRPEEDTFLLKSMLSIDDKELKFKD